MPEKVLHRVMGAKIDGNAGQFSHNNRAGVDELGPDRLHNCLWGFGDGERQAHT